MCEERCVGSRFGTLTVKVWLRFWREATIRRELTLDSPRGIIQTLPPGGRGDHEIMSTPSSLTTINERIPRILPGMTSCGGMILNVVQLFERFDRVFRLDHRSHLVVANNRPSSYYLGLWICSSATTTPLQGISYQRFSVEKPARTKSQR